MSSEFCKEKKFSNEYNEFLEGGINVLKKHYSNSRKGLYLMIKKMIELYELIENTKRDQELCKNVCRDLIDFAENTRGTPSEKTDAVMDILMGYCGEDPVLSWFSAQKKVRTSPGLSVQEVIRCL